MNELIKVSKNENNDVIVSAKELYEFLEISSNFTTWFKRMCEYGFEENVDFIEVWSDSNSGIAVNKEGSSQKMTAKGYKIDYAVKIDTAKEISMIQRNEKGKQARQYFIEIEKKHQSNAPSLPTTYKEALLALVEEVEKNEQLEQQLQIVQPKADKFDEFLDAEGFMTGKDVANIINIGRNTLYKHLRELKVYTKDNTPYQKYMNRDLFKVISKIYGSRVDTVTLITSKGADYIIELLKKNDVI